MTAPRELHVERLLSRRVVDVHGRRAGRVEELRAVRHGQTIEVREFLLGPEAVLRRLGKSMIHLPPFGFLARLGLAGRRYRVPWEQMDVSDPRHPRLRCAREALESDGDGDA